MKPKTLPPNARPTHGTITTLLHYAPSASRSATYGVYRVRLTWTGKAWHANLNARSTRQIASLLRTPENFAGYRETADQYATKDAPAVQLAAPRLSPYFAAEVQS